MLVIKKPDGSVYSGGMINGAASFTAIEAGTTTLICRAPNGRTQKIPVTINEPEPIAHTHEWVTVYREVPQTVREDGLKCKVCG